MLNTLTRASVTTARDFIRMLMDVPDTIAYRRLLLAQTTDIMIDASVAEATRAQSASAPNRKPDSTGISMAMMPGNTRLLNRPLSKIPVSNPPFSVLPAFFHAAAMRVSVLPTRPERASSPAYRNGSRIPSRAQVMTRGFRRSAWAR